jgi:osmotically-inducible protein OsmY
MCDNPELIERVQQSLRRLGYTQIEAEDLGGGRVRLSGKIRSFDERAIMVAAVRTVSGVTSVTLRLSA